MTFAAEIYPVLLHGSAWGGICVCVCDLNYRKKAAQMMRRNEVALMKGSGADDGGDVRRR
jgi:hypothetical protein